MTLTAEAAAHEERRYCSVRRSQRRFEAPHAGALTTQITRSEDDGAQRVDLKLHVWCARTEPCGDGSPVLRLARSHQSLPLEDHQVTELSSSALPTLMSAFRPVLASHALTFLRQVVRTQGLHEHPQQAKRPGAGGGLSS